MNYRSLARNILAGIGLIFSILILLILSIEHLFGDSLWTEVQEDGFRAGYQTICEEGYEPVIDDNHHYLEYYQKGVLEAKKGCD